MDGVGEILTFVAMLVPRITKTAWREAPKKRRKPLPIKCTQSSQFPEHVWNHFTANLAQKLNLTIKSTLLYWNSEFSDLLYVAFAVSKPA
jgi:hypothetical protein